MSALILIRSHIYDEHVRIAYETLKAFSRHSEPLLFLDVSRGDITTDIPTLKFDGARLRNIGMELYPEHRWAWFSGDYALYCAFLERPDHEHYMMIDYDVLVNFSVDDLVNLVSRCKYDLVAPYAGFERDDWMWTAAGRHWYERVAGCFFPVVLISRRLLVTCLEHRLMHSRRVPLDHLSRSEFLQKAWMNCEAFVPSVALSSGYSMIDIEKVVPNWSYKFFRDVDILYRGMPEIAAVPSAHPVFLRKQIPEIVGKRLASLPEGELRSLVVSRVKQIRSSDVLLWNDITACVPDLLEQAHLGQS